MTVVSIICLVSIIGIMVYIRRRSDTKLESEYAEFYKNKEDTIPDEEKEDIDDMFSLKKLQKITIKDVRDDGVTTAVFAASMGIPPEYVRGSKKNKNKNVRKQ